MTHKILLGLAGRNAREVLAKIKEAKQRGIKEVALFLEQLDLPGRRSVYQALEESGIKKIPFVHLRRDMSRAELVSLKKKYKTRYFNIHENHFKIINRWRGFYQQLYLEMNTDGHVAVDVKVEKIGGFCIDLAHYKKDSEKNNKEFTYVYSRKKNRRLFVCNHLNGYSYKDNTDLHRIGSKADFCYLKILPAFIFGRVIALEMYNPLAQQIKYKKYLENLLAKFPRP